MIKVQDLGVGDSVRCWDFQPRFMAHDRFVDGHIIEKTENTITVTVVFDSVFGDDHGKGGRGEITTPLAMVLGEWNGRIQLFNGGHLSAVDTEEWLNGGPVTWPLTDEEEIAHLEAIDPTGGVGS
jgi:hypothetical protein